MLPNLQRPTTPRAQRLVAFPQLASALDGDQGPSGMGMGHMGMGAHHSRGGSQWGNNDRSLGAAPPPPLGKGKAKYSDENERNVPSMPSLSQAMAPSQAAPTFGGSNLPQLKEGQLFAAELPDRYPGGGPGALSHAPVPASRGGGSKKKASAYDPSNPYFSKPSGKGKMKSSKASNSSHGQSSLGSSGQMGVVGQAHSIAGLSAAYALPPSALPPRTPNHDYDLGPPRTPGEGTANQLNQLSIEPGGHPGHQLGLGGGIGQSSHQQQSFGSTSGHGGYSQGGHGSHLHTSLGGRGNYYGGGGHTLGGGHNLNSVQYSGGQYAKYGKRF